MKFCRTFFHMSSAFYFFKSFHWRSRNCLIVFLNYLPVSLGNFKNFHIYLIITNQSACIEWLYFKYTKINLLFEDMAGGMIDRRGSIECQSESLNNSQTQIDVNSYFLKFGFIAIYYLYILVLNILLIVNIASHIFIYIIITSNIK